MFSFIRDAFTLFGSTTTPLWSKKRSRTCAGVAFLADAISMMTGSSRGDGDFVYSSLALPPHSGVWAVTQMFRLMQYFTRDSRV